MNRRARQHLRYETNRSWTEPVYEAYPQARIHRRVAVTQQCSSFPSTAYSMDVPGTTARFGFRLPCLIRYRRCCCRRTRKMHAALRYCYEGCDLLRASGCRSCCARLCMGCGPSVKGRRVREQYVTGWEICRSAMPSPVERRRSPRLCRQSVRRQVGQLLVGRSFGTPVPELS